MSFFKSYEFERELSIIFCPVVRYSRVITLTSSNAFLVVLGNECKKVVELSLKLTHARSRHTLLMALSLVYGFRDAEE